MLAACGQLMLYSPRPSEATQTQRASGENKKGHILMRAAITCCFVM